jgi:DNA-binding MarR family transcriptional regulator
MVHYMNFTGTCGEARNRPTTQATIGAMPNPSPTLSDSTPAGRLAEAKLNGVIGYQLAQAYIAASRVFKAQVGDVFDLRPVEYTILTLVNENPGGSSARLAQALAVTAPNITMWIDRLVKRGLVERIPSTTDRRSQHLHVSAEGARIAAVATQGLLDGELAAFDHLSVGERSILIELLHKVARRRKS